jgi:DNA-binding response OmpR family regulator
MPTRRALVVDDDENSRDLISDILDRLGVEAECADDGRTAMAALEENDYDILFLDINLPDMNGLEILKTKEGTSGQFKIVVSSGVDEQDGRRLCGSNTYDAYLAKPFTYDEFVKAVTPLLK